MVPAYWVLNSIISDSFTLYIYESSITFFYNPPFQYDLEERLGNRVLGLIKMNGLLRGTLSCQVLKQWSSDNKTSESDYKWTFELKCKSNVNQNHQFPNQQRLQQSISESFKWAVKRRTPILLNILIHDGVYSFKFISRQEGRWRSNENLHEHNYDSIILTCWANPLTSNLQRPVFTLPKWTLPYIYGPLN